MKAEYRITYLILELLFRAAALGQWYLTLVPSPKIPKAPKSA